MPDDQPHDATAPGDTARRPVRLSLTPHAAVALAVFAPVVLATVAGLVWLVWRLL